MVDFFGADWILLSTVLPQWTCCRKIGIMQLNRFDLNLLVALDMLLREQNVTHAADRMCISQPAMSGTLQRLREHFGDPLLVRSGREMALTPTAQALIKPVREILLSIEATLGAHRNFNPAEARRKFNVVMSDYVNLVLMPNVVRRLAHEAPFVQLHIVPLTGAAFAQLDAGDVDLCVMPDDSRLLGAQQSESARRYEHLFVDRWLGVVANDHPTVKDELTFEQFMQLPHLSVRSADSVLSVEQLTLDPTLWSSVKVEATVPGFLPMLFMLPGTSYLARVQERLARILVPSLPVRIVELPIQIPQLQESMIWHQRSELDPGHTWLREIITDVAKAMEANSHK